MVKLLLRLLMQRPNAAVAAAYQQGKKDGARLALDRLYDPSRNLYPGHARTIQQFLRPYL